MNLLTVPYIEQYFGPWAMSPERFWAEVEHVQKLNLSLHLSSEAVASVRNRNSSGTASYELQDGIALFDVSGKLMKQESSMGGTSTVAMRRAVRDAKTNPQVQAGMFRFDTPGGTVAGTAELGDDIAAFAADKPCMAYCEDLCASAGYWLASQCNSISVNRAGMVGSIGTYGVIYDQSARFAKEGVKAYVLRAGDQKGAGEPGTEITAPQLATMQDTINALNEHFLAAVATGRGMTLEKVRQLADGRVQVGQAAVALGLADKVETFDSAWNSLVQRITASRNRSL